MVFPLHTTSSSVLGAEPGLLSVSWNITRHWTPALTADSAVILLHCDTLSYDISPGLGYNESVNQPKIIESAIIVHSVVSIINFY